MPITNGFFPLSMDIFGSIPANIIFEQKDDETSLCQKRLILFYYYFFKSSKRIKTPVIVL